MIESHESIRSRDPVAKVNEAIMFPEYLTTPDGRKLIVKSWCPRVATGEFVTATVVVEIERAD